MYMVVSSMSSTLPFRVGFAPAGSYRGGRLPAPSAACFSPGQTWVDLCSCLPYTPSCLVSQLGLVVATFAVGLVFVDCGALCTVFSGLAVIGGDAVADIGGD